MANAHTRRRAASRPSSSASRAWRSSRWWSGRSGRSSPGDTDSIESAIALLVLTAVGAVAVLAFAVATWRGQSWGRSGGIVTQLLILAVALGAVTGAYARSADRRSRSRCRRVVTLVLLVLAVRAAGRGTRRDAASE